MKDSKQLNDFFTKQQLSAELIDSDALLQNFLSEMKLGLEDRKKSSLAMIPSYINPNATLPLEKPVIVLDAGGTNLRVAVVVFDSHGNSSISHFEQHQMPGIERELSSEEFYNLLCDYLDPVIDRADSIGFCFSYPSEISEQKDGKLLYWVKEVKVPEVVGTYIGEGLNHALKQRGVTPKKIVLLNDTVATLLACKAQADKRHCEGLIGFILGTGTNTAYVEENLAIPKVSLTEGSQIINVESGNFNKLERSQIDIDFCSKTGAPDIHVFEKMISGRYLGPLTLEVIKTAAKESLFSSSATKKLETLERLDSADLSIFLENPFNLTSPFYCEELSDSDREILYHIIDAMLNRAAKYTAINLSFAVLKSDQGKNPLHPVCINIDGSTYHKLYGFSKKAEFELKRIMEKHNRYVHLVQVDNSPIIGSAIAGLIA